MIKIGFSTKRTSFFCAKLTRSASTNMARTVPNDHWRHFTHSFRRPLCHWPLCLASIDLLFTHRYDSATKQEEVSDELASLKLDDFKEEQDGEKEALSKLVATIAKLYPFSIPSTSNESMQWPFLKSAGSGLGWALHADKPSINSQSYHGYVDSLYSAIRTINRHNETKIKSKSQWILCVGQKRYGNHPSQRNKPNSVIISFANQQQDGKMLSLHNRCFNFWTPGCSVNSFKHPCSPSRIKCNLDAWNKLCKVNNIHFIDVAARNIDPGEATEVFVASLIIEDSLREDSFNIKQYIESEDPLDIHISHNRYYDPLSKNDENQEENEQEILLCTSIDNNFKTSRPNRSPQK